MEKSLFLKLEEKVDFLIDCHLKQKKEISFLKERNKFLENNIKEQLLINSKLKESKEVLEISNALIGNKEHKKLMKWKINFLIKSIDRCIEQLKM